MTHLHDNPDLTDFAVGEADAPTRQRVEAQLAADPDARGEVDDLRRMAALLSDSLHAEPAPQLTAQQRHAALTRPRPAQRLIWWRLPLWVPLAAVALIVVTVSLIGYWHARTPALPNGQARHDGLERDYPNAYLSRRPIDEQERGPLLVFPRESMPAGVPNVAIRGHRPSPWPVTKGLLELPAVKVLPGSPQSRENPFLLASGHPVSSFPLDVETASYDDLRRYLARGLLPAPDAVRIDELINVFSYDYPAPEADEPLALLADVTACPWNSPHRLLRLAVKAADAPRPDRPAGQPAAPAPVARDVQLQVEFNPARVAGYRLIGYEARRPDPAGAKASAQTAPAVALALAKNPSDDMAAGQTVTALYEIVPASSPSSRPAALADTRDLLTLRLRYKAVNAPAGRQLTRTVTDAGGPFEQAGHDLRFAAAVASFGLVLRDSPYKGTATLDTAVAMAGGSLGADRDGSRAEFLRLIGQARRLTPTP